MFRDINTNVLRRFKTEFEKDENGQLLNWVAMEEPLIRDHWLKCKKNVEVIFKQFRYIEINYE